MPNPPNVGQPCVPVLSCPAHPHPRSPARPTGAPAFAPTRPIQPSTDPHGRSRFGVLVLFMDAQMHFGCGYSPAGVWRRAQNQSAAVAGVALPVAAGGNRKTHSQMCCGQSQVCSATIVWPAMGRLTAVREPGAESPGPSMPSMTHARVARHMSSGLDFAHIIHHSMARTRPMCCDR